MNFAEKLANVVNRYHELESLISEPGLSSEDMVKMNKELSPVLKTQDILVQPGKSVIFNLNSDLLRKDFNSKYSFGLNCYEKNWHWWQVTGKDMKYKRVRIIVDNDYNIR